MDRRNFAVIVCDNASADGSYEHLREWAEKNVPRLESANSPTKLQPLIEWTPEDGKPELQPEARIVLIQTGANLGFAGGCNVGLRYGLAHGDAEYFWLLNNDTVADQAALRQQIKKMKEHPNLGIVGSTLLFYTNPNEVQCCAGYSFNRWTARVQPVTEKVTAETLPKEAHVEARLHYVSGASMFVRRAFLEKIGLLNEQYFLYFEEIDWATRARDQYGLGYCSKSVVLHKEGRSIGSNREKQKRSLLSERYLSRNRILFMRTYYPWRLPIAFGWASCVALGRLLQGNAAQAWTVFSGACSGLQQNIHSQNNSALK
jgi:GT2 family glycosyltransferase